MSQQQRSEEEQEIIKKFEEESPFPKNSIFHGDYILRKINELDGLCRDKKTDAPETGKFYWFKNPDN